MTWYIVADSSCNLRSFETGNPDIMFGSVPLKIQVGTKEFIDNAELDIDELNRAVAAEQEASSSSCPSAGEWAEEFRRADKVIALTISSALSGCYEAAMMARTMVLDEHARANNGIISGKEIHVQDTRSAGAKLEILVEFIVRYLNENPDATFAEVVRYLEAIDAKMQITFSLSRYDNLVKNGRLPRLAGGIASKLNIRVFGTASDEGTIKVIGSTRGEKKAQKKIVERMESLGYHGGLVYIDHAQNDVGAHEMAAAIESRWPQATIRILPCGGLCSYYAEATGMIIGFEWCS